MIKFQLPIQSKEFKDGKLSIKKEYINCGLDYSAAAQLKWEETNPKLAESMSYFDYIDNLSKYENKNIAWTISCLKALYCCLVFEKDISCVDFLRMFDFSDAEYIKELTTTITEVFGALYPDKKKIS